MLLLVNVETKIYIPNQMERDNGLFKSSPKWNYSFFDQKEKNCKYWSSQCDNFVTTPVPINCFLPRFLVFVEVLES